MGTLGWGRRRGLVAAITVVLALAPVLPLAARADETLPAPSLSESALAARGTSSQTLSAPSSRGTSGWNPPATTGDFVVPGALRPAVDFWKKIFTVYTTDEAVIHHAYDLSLVYATLDFRDLRGHPRAERLRKARIAAEIDRIRRRHPGLREDDIHVQSGIRDRVERGLIVSHRYLPEIERIFREEGLPPQLTRLPFVESSFNVNAVSKVGASGIWQFMPSTGRLYMRVGTAVDERNDPIISSRGAARLLRHNYDETGRWSLAITAYNHGLGGVVRAVRVTGSRNIVDIIRNYREASFGFASRNFYAEFLAALEVDRDYRKYFGALSFDRPFAHDEIRLRSAILARDLLGVGLTRDEIESFNPALTSAAFSGRAAIPAGTALRVPLGRGERIVAALDGVAPVEMRRYAETQTSHHRVRRGETLRSVAKRYELSRASLARANGLSTRAKLRRGQVLRVPLVVRLSRPVVRAASAGSYDNAVLVRRSNPAPIIRDATRIASAEPSPRIEAVAEEAPDEAAPSDEATVPSSPASDSPGWKPAGLGATNPVDATALVLEHGTGRAPGAPRLSSPVLVAAEKIGLPLPAAPVEPPAAVPPLPPPAPKGSVVASSSSLRSPAAQAAEPLRAGAMSSAGAVKGPGAFARASAPAPSESAASPKRPLSSPGAVIGAFPTRSARAVKDDENLDPEEPDPPARQVIAKRETSRHVTHVVKRNETLWDIARRYEVPVSSVRRANPGKKLAPLMPGTRLQIPVRTGRT